MFLTILRAILQAALPAIIGALIQAGLIKATAPQAYSAPLGLSSTGLYFAAGLVAGLWLSIHPEIGNLVGKANEALKNWVRSCFAQPPAK